MMSSGFGLFGGFGMLFGLLFTVGLLVGFVALVVWSVRQFSGGDSTVQSPDRTTDLEKILKARYAGGELTREEYESMLADIRN